MYRQFLSFMLPIPEYILQLSMTGREADRSWAKDAPQSELAVAIEHM